MFYRICGFTIQSDIPLTELPYTDCKRADYKFNLITERRVFIEPINWFHHWRTPDGHTWLSFANLEGDYLLRFPDIADFIIPSSGGEIQCHLVSSAPLETIRHLLIDQVFPLFLSHHGFLVLHASSIATPEGAIVFLGITGMGKSTLAASFSLEGYPILTDDYFILDSIDGQLCVTPSYPSVRLWDDSISSVFKHRPSTSGVAHYTNKKRLTINNGELLFYQESVRLHRVYCIGYKDNEYDGCDVIIEPISARDAFIEMATATFKLDIFHQGTLVKEFRKLDQISRSPIFYQLSFLRDFDFLPTVRRVIIDHIRSE